VDTGADHVTVTWLSPATAERMTGASGAANHATLPDEVGELERVPRVTVTLKTYEVFRSIPVRVQVSSPVTQERPAGTDSTL
jgi:hypothetical protein